MYEENLPAILERQVEYNSGMDSEAMMELARIIISKEKDSREDRRRQSRIPTVVHVDEDMDIVGDPEYVAAMRKEGTPCAAVRKRDDIFDTDEFYVFMRRTNAEQHKLLREAIHRSTTPGSKQLWVFLTDPAGCGKTYVLRLIMDMYNRYYNDSADACRSYNAYVVCASTGKAAVALGGTTVHAAFKLMRHNDGGLRYSDLNTLRAAFTNVRRAVRIMPDWVSIELYTATVMLDRKTGLACRRKQFPVVQVSAVTVRKSRGVTHSSVVYE
ncbi:hypothetical protein IscW_ISCW011380 [Ixodes scapularis]|uniref:ATP-dependent DNA helicase n=1 Tax=Ixodes scapularis TaxID=6945 RepID=B7Q847_IXOSC|nr:hypothetical protein IscW_ISCW011380 [Ixodes scapularis]|eukprot:XP_002412284.1 hypothetical protein IscW_ISCW011380 [Ixodes scapularis]